MKPRHPFKAFSLAQWPKGEGSVAVILADTSQLYTLLRFCSQFASNHFLEACPSFGRGYHQKSLSFVSRRKGAGWGRKKENARWQLIQQTRSCTHLTALGLVFVWLPGCLVLFVCISFVSGSQERERERGEGGRGGRTRSKTDYL